MRSPLRAGHGRCPAGLTNVRPSTRQICNCRPLAAGGCNVTNSLRLAWAANGLVAYTTQSILDVRHGVMSVGSRLPRQVRFSPQLQTSKHLSDFDALGHKRKWRVLFDFDVASIQMNWTRIPHIPSM